MAHTQLTVHQICESRERLPSYSRILLSGLYPMAPICQPDVSNIASVGHTTYVYDAKMAA